MIYINEIGKLFGSLWVLKRVSKVKGVVFLCRCLCKYGSLREVKSYELRSGDVKCCKKCSLDIVIKNETTHGLSKHRLYSTHRNMIQRCYNPKNKHYKNYGGRGVRVCDEWLGIEGLVRFYNWALTSGYRDDLTIERSNPKINYCPENCCWIPIEEQYKTRRNTIKIVKNNVTYLSLGEFCTLTSLVYSKVQRRLKEGWSLSDCLMTPNGVWYRTYPCTTITYGHGGVRYGNK